MIDSPQFRAVVAQFVAHARSHNKAETTAGQSNRAGIEQLAAIEEALQAAQALQRVVEAYPTIAKWYAVRSPLGDFQADVAGLQRLADALRLTYPETRAELVRRPRIGRQALQNLIACIVVTADQHGIARPKLYDGDPLLQVIHQAAIDAGMPRSFDTVRRQTALVLKGLGPARGDKPAPEPPT